MSNDDESTLGPVLWAVRMAKGIPATRVARCAGVNRRTYTRYESGEYIPSTGILKRIGVALDLHFAVVAYLIRLRQIDLETRGR